MTLSNLLAYVGPGPGLTMFWAFVALLGTIGLAILYLLIWPVRMLIRRARGDATPSAESSPPDAAKNSDAATGPR
jgi:hypothetical protein